MKPMRLTFLVLATATVVAFAGIGRPDLVGGASQPTGGITVTGTGTVKVVPNEAQFSVGVESRGATAKEALAANSEQMNRVLTALRAAGVAKEDLQTQEVSVSQNYSSDGQPDGYSASNSVSVTVRELAKAGTILDAASRAGANNVYGPTLTRSDQEGLQTKALHSAFENARAKALALAEAAGVDLGSVTSISESQAGMPEPYFDAVALSSTRKAPIEPGTQDVRATVNVTFAIG